MTSMFGGVERPGPWETTGDHERRIRALEALENCCDGDFCDSSGQTTYPDLILAHPCIAHYWPADEASGDLIDRVDDWDLAPDIVGGFPTYGAEGPFPVLPAYTSVVNDGTEGPSGSASRFAYVFGGAPSYWFGTAEMTVEVWGYLTEYPSVSEARLFGAGTGLGGELRLYVFSGSSGLTFVRGGSSVSDPDVFPLNAWQYIVARYDGTNLDLFRNGVLVDSTPSASSIDVAGTMAFLNRQGTGNWAPWNGRAAQLAVYNCALTDDEILEHYEGSTVSGNAPAGYAQLADGEGGCEWGPVPSCDSSGTPLDEEILANPCLEAFWKLNETSGDIAADSKNGYDMDSGAGVPPTWAAETTPYGELSPRFNGQTSGELLISSAFPALTGDLAIEIWARRPIDDGGFAMINQGDPWPANGTGVGIGWLGSGSGYAVLGTIGDSSGGPHQITLDELLPGDDWHHFVLTRESNVWTFYIDAVVIGTFDDGGTNYSTATGMQIGNIAGALTPNNFEGNLSYGAAYSCALSAEDVADHYVAGVNAGNVSAGEVQLADGEGGCEWGCPQVDSTENVDDCWGVHSLNGTTAEADGLVLTSDGEGGSSWEPVPEDLCTGTIDSTENAGSDCGVHSLNGTTSETDGFVLTADGSGGSSWEPIPAPETADKVLQLKIIDDATVLTTGDGQLIFMADSSLNGFNLIAVAGFVSTVSSSGLPTVQIRNVTQAADMLSTRITIDVSEFTSYTATTPPVIDTGNDDVATGDLIAVDVDVAGTGAKGLGVVLTFGV